MSTPKIENEYRFRGFHVNAFLVSRIQAYVETGCPLGHFLTAIICNDLQEAVERADDENIHNLPAFVGYFYNETPGACWGSKEKMKAWIKAKREEREAEGRK